jgi:hypothetical protein
VIGIGRSGGIWGGWLAGNLGSLPFGVIEKRMSVKNETFEVDFPGGEEIIKTLLRNNPSITKVLIVEGATSGGKVLTKFKESFSHIFGEIDVKFAVLYKNPASSANINFVGQTGPEPWPEKFPWHYSNLYRPYLRDIFVDKK